MKYYAILKKGLSTKKIKNIMGHLFLKENQNILMFILDNQERLFVNISKYDIIHFSDGWFKMEVERVNIESQGQAKVK